jgi:hypothetical protein
MITQQLLQHGRGAVERFGVKVVALVALGCCLFPVIVSGLCCLGLLLALAEWR